ncbi:amino acid permease [Rhizomicrobium electricum]|jgi:APA family basic amino acid/polyamine antiporter|uniref:Amino acid permease n=1 Tax=Rhizomicrobium electricum TaxID=480070 RepID=A0ABN1E5V2_9PROT|nr:amino acid permease [Rhizomicrobium electricum]NIJ47736.1 APA family basic amino acid/polyamine antiporter [Rhizomicrobium electricum]
MADIDDSDLTQPEPVVASEHQLKRALGPVSLIMIGIGSVLGAGIFVVAGTAAATHAGPAVLLSFVIAALGCLFAGLCYAEFASMIPESGSSYTYAYATMGRFMAWFIGWNMVLEYLAAGSTVAVGWSGYFVSFLQHFGVVIAPALTNAPLAGTGLESLHLTGALLNLPAVVLIFILTFFLLAGVRETAKFNDVMVLIKCGVVLLVIGFGLGYVRLEHLTPFIPANTGHWGHFGVSGVLAASGIIFFSFVGFESVSVAAQEARNPRRDLPIGILGSLAICTGLYMLMALVLTGVTDWRTLDVANPVSFAMSKIPGLGWLTLPIDIGAIVGLASVTFVSLYGQSRIFYSMARDGFLPPAFAKVHPRSRTPYIGTIITSAFAALLAAVFPLDILAELVSVGTLLAFIAVCVGVLILRITAPRATRRFRIPAVWLIAPAGVIVCAGMMVSLFFSSPDTGWRLVIWTAIGVAIYLVYGVWHAAPSKWKVTNED